MFLLKEFPYAKIGLLLFLKFTKPVYQVKAKLLIKENDSKMGGIGKGTDMLQSLGIMSGANSVDNELEIITTYSILDKVVKDLQLNIIYTKKDIFGNEIIEYGNGHGKIIKKDIFGNTVIEDY